MIISLLNAIKHINGYIQYCENSKQILKVKVVL